MHTIQLASQLALNVRPPIRSRLPNEPESKENKTENKGNLKINEWLKWNKIKRKFLGIYVQHGHKTIIHGLFLGFGFGINLGVDHLFGLGGEGIGGSLYVVYLTGRGLGLCCWKEHLVNSWEEKQITCNQARAHNLTTKYIGRYVYLLVAVEVVFRDHV